MSDPLLHTSLPVEAPRDEAEWPFSSDSLTRGLMSVLEHSGAGLSLKDAAGRYVWANRAMATMLDQPRAALEGATDVQVLGPVQGAEVRAADQRALAAASMTSSEHQIQVGLQRRICRTLRVTLRSQDTSKPGVERRTEPYEGHVFSVWWDDSLQKIENANRLRAALTQIEQQQVALDKLTARYRDGLDRPVSLLRDDAFEVHLRRELALSAREHREFALVFLVIDQAASLRASQGAEGFARVGETVGQLLRANTRSMDMICRLGEERFGILLSGVGLATAHTRMEQFRRQCAGHIVLHDGLSISFSVSAGVASFPHSAEALDDLAGCAERALLTAQVGTGNRVTLATIALETLARLPGEEPTP